MIGVLFLVTRVFYDMLKCLFLVVWGKGYRILPPGRISRSTVSGLCLIFPVPPPCHRISGQRLVNEIPYGYLFRVGD